MRARSAAALLAGLMALGSTGARAQIQALPREVHLVYWELLKTSEIFVRLIPEDAAGTPPLVSLTFRAYFPGVARRNPRSGQPEWPLGKPARMTLTAEPLPHVLIRDLTLRLEFDGSAIDLTGPGSRYRNIPCLVYSDECAPNGVEVAIEPPFLRSFVAARRVDGRALGFAIRLTEEDLAAVAEFASRIGLGQT